MSRTVAAPDAKSRRPRGSSVEVELWTDGSGTVAGSPGGWAYVLTAVEDGKPIYEEDSGGTLDGTNNQMELTAAIEGLRSIGRPTKVILHTDSEYVMKGFTEKRVDMWKSKGWRTRSGSLVANRHLWEELASLVERHDVVWDWVRGHAGVEHNERCDVLAGVARRTAMQGNVDRQGKA